MNKEQVKDALERCLNCRCPGCPYEGMRKCIDVLLKDALTLITEQEEHIEMLQQDIDGCGEEIERLEKAISDQNEQCWNCNKSAKEFAEKLKEKLEDCYIPYCFETPIDEFAYNAKEVEKIITELLKEYEK